VRISKGEENRMNRIEFYVSKAADTQALKYGAQNDLHHTAFFQNEVPSFYAALGVKRN